MDDYEIGLRLGGEFGPKKTLVKFVVGAIPDEEETKKRGYPVFGEFDMISKHADGDRDFVSSYVNLDEDPQRYPKEWEAFQIAKTKRYPIPLTALPKMRAGVHATLRALGINTVDDLIEKDVPTEFAEYKTWAQQLKRLHDFAYGAPKPRIKLETA